MWGLEGRIVLVTGASRGLGEAISERLVMEGAHLILTAREETQLLKVCNRLVRLANNSQQVVAIKCDV